MDSIVINFMSPPVPYYIGSGTEHYRTGEKHINRFNTGVFDIIFVDKGTLFIGEGENNWELKEGEVLILRPDLYHYGVSECKEETTIHWCHFHTVGKWEEHDSMHDYLKNLTELKEMHKIIPTYLINPISIPKYFSLTEKGVSLIHELISLHNEPRSIAAWKQQTAFQFLLQEMDCEKTQAKDITALNVAEKVKQYIEKNYQSHITNERIKEELNYHPNYLARCMRKVYGCTPLEYLTKYRLAKAKRLLLNTNLTIEKISEEVGFELSTFSNSFKVNEGISPRNYRNNYYMFSQQK